VIDSSYARMGGCVARSTINIAMIGRNVPVGDQGMNKGGGQWNKYTLK